MVFMCIQELLRYLQRGSMDDRTSQISFFFFTGRGFVVWLFDAMALIEHNLLRNSATADCPTLFIDALRLVETLLNIQSAKPKKEKHQ